MRNLGDIELEITLVLESFEQELVFSLGECRDCHEISIDTQTNGDLRLIRIVVDIGTSESESASGDERQSFITILLLEECMEFIHECREVPVCGMIRVLLLLGFDEFVKVLLILDRRGHTMHFRISALSGWSREHYRG